MRNRKNDRKRVEMFAFHPPLQLKKRFTGKKSNGVARSSEDVAKLPCKSDWATFMRKSRKNPGRHTDREGTELVILI